MIKRLIDKLLNKPAKPNLGKRLEVPPEKHHIDVELVDGRACDVIDGLHEAGYKAYIVGGAVRDLLLGLNPKDFDIATDATPEQVKSLFRRSFIIGKRFRIVHVVYGRGRAHEVIEVSTFRASFDAATAQLVHGNERTAKAELANKNLAMDESGRVLRDNVWGTQEEDAARRDFTINAMYYDPIDQIVVDYHNGFKDAQKRVLRMIGDAAVRYREDPVRILRVVRFSAKLAQLGFEIDEKTRAPIKECLPLLKGIPASRMFDEMTKLLQTGHAQASIQALRKQGLLGIFPMLDGLIQDEKKYPLAWLALADTDERIAQGKSVVPSFMLASLLWPEVKKQWETLLEQGEHQIPALHQAISEVFDRRVGDVSGRGKLGADMREIWLMQPRFEKRTGTAPFSLINQARFRAAFDFMRLRAEAGEYSSEIAHWWEVFSTGDEAIRVELIQQAQAEKKSRKAAAPRKSGASGRRSSNGSHGSNTSASHTPKESTAADKSPAKRRRRRKPANKGDDFAQAASFEKNSQ